jgi:hypothetical protein
MRALHFIWHLTLGLTIIAGIGAIVMLLWNGLMPGIFGLTGINFWQALGLFALSRVLFGGFGGGRIFDAHRRFHKNHIREKWIKMTPEERKEFIYNRHFGHGIGHWNPDFFNDKESEKKD